MTTTETKTATRTRTATAREPRLRFPQVAPKALQAMLALEKSVKDGLEPSLAELVRIRASQINRCAHCLAMHTADARKGGESERRIYLLNAWREAGVFTEREQAALALTEVMTDLPAHGVPDDVWARAAASFTEAELGQLITLIFTINAWNRIAISTGLGADPE